MQAIGKSDIQQALDKVLASDAFRLAGKLSRFLRFTVESTARGEADRIKEYVVGVEVFDRDSDYDPRLDPVVRVEARRLRAKLHEYYAGEGATDAIRIEFPKGGYVPVFQRTTPEPAKVDRRPVLIAGVGALLVAAGVLWTSRTPPKRLAVLPMRAYSTTEPEELNRIADQACEQIIAAAVREPGIAVTAWPTAFGYKASGKRGAEVGRELGVDAVAVVWARAGQGSVNVNIHMMDIVADRKMFVDSYAYSAGRSSEVARHLRERLLQK